jgi:hypothetical protein
MAWLEQVLSENRNSSGDTDLDKSKDKGKPETVE